MLVTMTSNTYVPCLYCMVSPEQLQLVELIFALAKFCLKQLIQPSFGYGAVLPNWMTLPLGIVDLLPDQSDVPSFDFDTCSTTST